MNNISSQYVDGLELRIAELSAYSDQLKADAQRLADAAAELVQAYRNQESMHGQFIDVGAALADWRKKYGGEG